MKRSSRVAAPLLASTAMAILSSQPLAAAENPYRYPAPYPIAATALQENDGGVERGGFGLTFGQVVIIAAFGACMYYMDGVGG